MAEHDAAAGLQAEIEDLKKQILYAQAETQNVRRRMEKDAQDARAYAATSFARDILSVSDNLARALAAIPPAMREDEGTKPLVNQWGSPVYGSGLPSDIWKETMDGALEGTDDEDFPQPTEIGGYAGVPAAPPPRPTPTAPPTPPPGTVIQPSIELAPGITIPLGPPTTVPAPAPGAPPVPGDPNAPVPPPGDPNALVPPPGPPAP